MQPSCTVALFGLRNVLSRCLTKLHNPSTLSNMLLVLLTASSSLILPSSLLSSPPSLHFSSSCAVSPCWLTQGHKGLPGAIGPPGWPGDDVSITHIHPIHSNLLFQLLFCTLGNDWSPGTEGIERSKRRTWSTRRTWLAWCTWPTGEDCGCHANWTSP